jgi:hypothetical protein
MCQVPFFLGVDSGVKGGSPVLSTVSSISLSAIGPLRRPKPGFAVSRAKNFPNEMSISHARRLFQPHMVISEV